MQRSLPQSAVSSVNRERIARTERFVKRNEARIEGRLLNPFQAVKDALAAVRELEANDPTLQGESDWILVWALLDAAMNEFLAAIDAKARPAVPRKPDPARGQPPRRA